MHTISPLAYHISNDMYSKGRFSLYIKRITKMPKELNLDPKSINDVSNHEDYIVKYNNPMYLVNLRFRFWAIQTIALHQPILAAQIICGCSLPQEEEKAHVLPKLLEICSFDYRPLTQEQQKEYAYSIEKTLREKKEAAQYAVRFGVIVCYKCGNNCQNGKNHIAQNVAIGSDFYGENSDPTGRTFSEVPATHETLTFHNPKTTYQCTNPKCGHTFTASDPQTNAENSKEDDECVMYLMQKVTIKNSGQLDILQLLNLIEAVCNLPKAYEVCEKDGVTFEFGDASLYENPSDYEQ